MDELDLTAFATAVAHLGEQQKVFARDLPVRECSFAYRHRLFEHPGAWH